MSIVLDERNAIYNSRTRVALDDSIYFEEPKLMNAGKGTPWVLAPAHHVDPNGKKRSLRFISPKQFVYNTIRPKINTNGQLKEYFVKFPLQSMETANLPSDEESTFEYYLDTVYQQSYEYLCKLYETDKAKPRSDRSKVLPPNFGPTMMTALNEKDPSIALKPVKLPGASLDPKTKDLPKDKKVFIVDPSKPWSTFFKIWTNGTPCDKLYCQIRGPGNRSMDIIKDQLCSFDESYESQKSARVILLVAFDGIYFGAHGTTQSWCDSLRFRIMELNYTPAAAPKGVSYLGDNEDDESATQVKHANPYSLLDNDDEDEEQFNVVKVTAEPTRNATPPPANTSTYTSTNASTNDNESSVKSEVRKKKRSKHHKDREEDSS